MIIYDRYRLISKTWQGIDFQAFRQGWGSTHGSTFLLILILKGRTFAFHPPVLSEALLLSMGLPWEGAMANSGLEKSNTGIMLISTI